MAGIFPFCSVQYRDVHRLASLVAPPYDVISPEEQQALYDLSPHNIVRLELGQRSPEAQSDPYEAAASLLHEWMHSGVLTRSVKPGFIIYRQTYQLPGGSQHTRTGFFAEVQLEEFSTGIIRPHEETFAGPKEDRLRLLRACRANLSPIFGLYPDHPDVSRTLAAAASAAPDADFLDTKGIRHQMWSLQDSAACETITSSLAESHILIADGHHRYETALAYRKERRESGNSHWPQRALFVLVSMGDSGLVVLPTHRVLRRVNASTLDGWQGRLGGATVLPIPSDVESIEAALKPEGGESRFVLVLPDGCHLLKYGPGQGSPLDCLDVSRLHREVLPAVAGSGDPHELDIEYTQDAGLALDRVREGRAAAALLVNPTPVEKVNLVASTGDRMPEKSTYFYPKLSTGLVLRVEGE
ncbi:MAG: DUF1015 domain-containing protein [Armatimonadota bacterium]|nr:DUF1015 domain-containing protein [Armatimonadota bacterium]